MMQFSIRSAFSHRGQFAQVRVDLLKGACSLLAVDILVILLPWFVKAIIDRLNGAAQAAWVPQSWFQLSNLLFIFVVCCLYLAAIAAIAFFRYWWRVYIIWASFPVAHKTRLSLFKQLHSFDREFFKQEKVGDLLSALTGDTENMRMTISIGALMLIDAIINFALFPILMYRLDPVLTSYIFPFLLLTTGVSIFLSRFVGEIYDRVQESTASLSSLTYEIFSAIRVVKGFHRESVLLKKFEASGEDLKKASLKVAMYESLFGPSLQGILGMALSFVLVFGGFRYFNGEIELSNLVSFQLYLNHLDWPMVALGWFIQTYRRSRASASRIANFANYENATVRPSQQSHDSMGDRRPGSLAPRFSLKKMIFRFNDGLSFQLGPMNLEIPEGCWVGVSGPFGGGKTTLLELLSRQRNPDQGCIFYGGVDLKYLPEDFVRSKIVQVPQDAFIFSRSVRKNILLDGSNRNDDLLYALLSKLSFNRRLIDERGGLNAQLGERGVNLSGGQKQRLALSRALLLDRDVYLFDDVFSHVDVETEHYLIRGLKEILPKNSTVFLVSQRSQTLRICDWNLILNAGALEFWGTPTQGLWESHFLKDIEGLNHVARS